MYLFLTRRKETDTIHETQGGNAQKMHREGVEDVLRKGTYL